MPPLFVFYFIILVHFFSIYPDEINAELPLYKRIVKTIVRSDEFEKTASGKIKRKHNN